MPELPEVELVARYLRPHLVGRRIAQVATTKPSYFFLTAPATLRRQLPERRVEELTRLGKYLLAELDDGKRLLLHLGMTGQLIVAGARSPRLVSAQRRAPALPSFEPDRHTHLSLEFDDGGPNLFFRDTRKFGKVRLLLPGQEEPRLSKLGPDALGLLAADLVLASRSRKAPVKSFLLDQTVTAGIGNIYADESLYLARIDPRRAAQTLSPLECQRLALTVRRLLRHSIRAGGSSIDDYVHPDGSDGQFQSQFNVYNREGESCRSCGRALERTALGGRSTHFCSHCQK